MKLFGKTIKIAKKEELELLQDPYYYYKRVAAISFLVACLVMLPSMFFELFKTGKLIFLYYGDYNVQQVPFYEHCVRMVHEGNFGWDWLTDLGSNFIGSYSYYLIGSPFFWIMCLFPASWAPYLMGPIYILKFVTASVIAYAYFKRFVKEKEYAVIGAILYSFCGFQIYNLFFNQFHEVVALFPLLLLGIEELVQNNRKGVFAVAVMLNCMCNYFMFAGQVVFCLLYFFFRCIKRSFKINLKNFLFLAFESVLGVCMGAIVFMPACLGILGNYRLGSSFSTTRAMLVYGSSKRVLWERYGHIIQSLFFPPDIPSRINFFYAPNSIYQTRWASNAAWIPAFGLSGVFAWVKSHKKSALGWFVFVLVGFALVPVFNSAFFLFNSAYYARWMYLLVIIAVVCTIMALDDLKTDFGFGFGVNTAVIAAVTAISGLVWVFNPTEKDYFVYSLGREPFADRLWASVAIAVFCMVGLHFLFKRYRGTRIFPRALLCFVCVAVVIYSNVHILTGKQHSTDTVRIVNEAAEGELNLPDEENFYRINFYRTPDNGIKDKNAKTMKHTNVFDNLGISWQTPSVENFHSVIPASINEFYYNVTGTRRAVGSRYDYSKYGLNGFLSVKYSFLRKGFDGGNKSSRHPTDNIYGLSFEYIDQQNNYNIYRNNNYLDMGFYYDTFVTNSDFKKITASNRHVLLCKYLVVPDDMAEYYSRFMKQAVYNSGNLTENQVAMVKVTSSNSVSSEKIYLDSLNERRNCVCDTFEYGSYSFNATINLEKDNIVMFTVPYEDGWTAEVNGKPTEILTVTYGFMGVECSGSEDGNYDIVFKYKTPGLNIGALLSLAAVIVFVIYLIIMRKKNETPTYRFFKEDYIETEDSERKKSDEKQNDDGQKPALPLKTSPKAKNALIVAILGIPVLGPILGSAAIFNGIRALPETQGDSPEYLGKGMAVCAIIIGSLDILATVFMMIYKNNLMMALSVFLK